MDYFEGKIAVITGAASGIGRALALQLNRSGCELFISDVNEQGLEETARSMARQDVAVDTSALDAKTMMARDVPGLFFIGEAVDVTGARGTIE